MLYVLDIGGDKVLSTLTCRETENRFNTMVIGYGCATTQLIIIIRLH
ncbi:hypothetical protein ACVNP1_12850 [Staphylococcus aureus]